MKATLLVSALAAVALASPAIAQSSSSSSAEVRHMSDAEFAHCYAIGLAEKANVQDGIDFMQRPDQQGNFTADDIQKMKDFIKGVDDDYMTWFDSDQAYDQSEVEAWRVKDHNEIDAELDRCFDLLDGDMQALMNELGTMSDSSSSSSQ